jgi:hypothetical protein
VLGSPSAATRDVGELLLATVTGALAARIDLTTNGKESANDG